jgi:hypothetical protein
MREENFNFNGDYIINDMKISIINIPYYLSEIIFELIMADMSIICRRKNINAKMLFSNYI